MDAVLCGVCERPVIEITKSGTRAHGLYGGHTPSEHGVRGDSMDHLRRSILTSSGGDGSHSVVESEPLLVHDLLYGQGKEDGEVRAVLEQCPQA